MFYLHFGDVQDMSYASSIRRLISIAPRGRAVEASLRESSAALASAEAQVADARAENGALRAQVQAVGTSLVTFGFVACDRFVV